MHTKEYFLTLLIYIDDGLGTGTYELAVIKVNKFLHKHIFFIKDIGYVKYFLGFEIARSSKGTYIDQRKIVYIF